MSPSRPLITSRGSRQHLPLLGQVQHPLSCQHGPGASTEPMLLGAPPQDGTCSPCPGSPANSILRSQGASQQVKEMIYNTTESLPWARLWGLLSGEFAGSHHRGAKGAESGCESGWWLSKEAKENLPAESRLSRRVTKQEEEISRHLLPPKQQRLGRNRDHGQAEPSALGQEGLAAPTSG